MNKETMAEENYQKTYNYVDGRSSSMLSNYEIQTNYFSQPTTNPDLKRAASIPSLQSIKRNIEEDYSPRIISLSSANGADYLDLLIGSCEGKRTLMLEGKGIKKTTAVTKVYDTEIEENRWYNLLLTYSEKSKVSLYLSSEL